MPMIDLTVPSDVLSDQAKAKLMATLTRTLLKWEGAKPGEQGNRVDRLDVVHEPTLVTVAGQPVTEPRYRVVVGGHRRPLDDGAKRGLVAEVTDQVLRSE